MTNVRVHALAGEIDIWRKEWIEQELGRVELSGPKSVTILDLKNVSFADTTLLNALMRMHERAARQRNDGTICIVAPSHLARLLKITALDKIFPTFTDFTSARIYANAYQDQELFDRQKPHSLAIA